MPQYLLCQLPEFWRARQVGAVTREIDPGQHDLGMTALDQRADLIDHRAHRHRARIAAAIGDDAEGAAVIAAVLHLHERPRQAALKAFQQMRRHLGDRHDVGDRDLFAGSTPNAGIERRARVAPGVTAHLVVIADDAIDLGHLGEHRRLGLRRAAGDDDARSGRSRFSRRIDCRACATASLVTAQLLMTMVSSRPASLRLARGSLRIRTR